MKKGLRHIGNSSAGFISIIQNLLPTPDEEGNGRPAKSSFTAQISNLKSTSHPDEEGLLTESERAEVWQQLMMEVDLSENKLCYYKCFSVCRQGSGTSDGQPVGEEAAYWLV